MSVESRGRIPLIDKLAEDARYPPGNFDTSVFFVVLSEGKIHITFPIFKQNFGKYYRNQIRSYWDNIFAYFHARKLKLT